MMRVKLGRKEDEESDEEEDDEFLNDEDRNTDDALSDEYDEHKGKGRFSSKKKQASIDFYSYEFEHLIKGKKGDQLTRYLAELPLTSSVFESTTIQAFMDVQWQQFKWKFY